MVERSSIIRSFLEMGEDGGWAWGEGCGEGDG